MAANGLFLLFQLFGKLPSLIDLERDILIGLPKQLFMFKYNTVDYVGNDYFLVSI